MKPADNASNMQNPNKGSDGTNRQYDQNVGNTGKQLNPTPNDANTPTKTVAPPTGN